jgi:hypothetical protein
LKKAKKERDSGPKKSKSKEATPEKSTAKITVVEHEPEVSDLHKTREAESSELPIEVGEGLEETSKLVAKITVSGPEAESQQIEEPVPEKRLTPEVTVSEPDVQPEDLQKSEELVSHDLPPSTPESKKTAKIVVSEEEIKAEPSELQTSEEVASQPLEVEKQAELNRLEEEVSRECAQLVIDIRNAESILQNPAATVEELRSVNQILSQAKLEEIEKLYKDLDPEDAATQDLRKNTADQLKVSSYLWLIKLNLLSISKILS